MVRLARFRHGHMHRSHGTRTCANDVGVEGCNKDVILILLQCDSRLAQNTLMSVSEVDFTINAFLGSDSLRIKRHLQLWDV